MAKSKIIVCAHKNDFVLSNDVFRPLQVGKAQSAVNFGFDGDDTGDNISHKNPNYCELTGLYWAWKNMTDYDFVGLAHYRRYFDFSKNASKIDYVRHISVDDFCKLQKTWQNPADALGDYDIILPNPWYMNESVSECYIKAHLPEEYHPLINEALKEYAEGNVAELVRHNPNAIQVDQLHLAVSMRSFRAENLSKFVHYVLDRDIEQAKKLYRSFKDKYPVVLTRDLNKAKKWLEEKARGSERYGIVVSSQAYRLKPLAIDVRLQPDIESWFLADKMDVRSSLFLEDAATEFDIQGLELDWTCLVWDGDFRYTPDGWDHNSFRGSKWMKIRQAEAQSYQLNAYRVLMTRARQGMIICVPNGNTDDHTRLPEFYNSTYFYLKSIGLEEI